MLFQMLAGVLPFRGDSMAELMYKIANEPAPDIRIIRPDLSEKLANVVALSISKKPETRYQDGDQFAADLRALFGDYVAVVGTQSSLQAEAAKFDTTVVQSAAAYEATETMQAEPSIFEKTTVN